MRYTFLTLAILAVFAIPAAAHADSFTFTPDQGSSISFNLDPSQIIWTDPGVGVSYYPITTTTGDTIQLVFYIPDSWIPEPMDFEIFILDGANFPDGTLYGDYYDGPNLFTGDLTAPVFIPGSYDLTASDHGHGTETGRLVIDGGGPAPVPEPSSLALLGTGIAGLGEMLRRRGRVTV
jgi:PEP-CTERM motif